MRKRHLEKKQTKTHDYKQNSIKITPPALSSRRDDWGPRGFGENGYLFSVTTGSYFRGAGEQAHSSGDLGSPAKKEKPLLKISSASGGGGGGDNLWTLVNS